MIKLINKILNLAAILFLAYGLTNVINAFFVHDTPIKMSDALIVGGAIFKLFMFNFKEEM